jgi:hypothetical protein
LNKSLCSSDITVRSMLGSNSGGETWQNSSLA